MVFPICSCLTPSRTNRLLVPNPIHWSARTARRITTGPSAFSPFPFLFFYFLFLFICFHFKFSFFRYLNILLFLLNFKICLIYDLVQIMYLFIFNLFRFRFSKFEFVQIWTDYGNLKFEWISNFVQFSSLFKFKICWIVNSVIFNFFIFEFLQISNLFRLWILNFPDFKFFRSWICSKFKLFKFE
jgi:hypothetical protein